MLRKLTFVSMWLLLSVASACASSSTAGTGTPTPTGASSPTSQPSGTPVSYDPCVLVNVQDASTLTGVNYPPGREDLQNATKVCTYGYQTRDVLEVGIVQAPDLATIQAEEAKAQAALQQQAGPGMSFTQVQGVGDAAYELQGSRSGNGNTLALSGIYVVKGLIFFFIADVAVNQAVPTSAALQDEAMKVLSRL
jgi:hypothetical protein